MKEGNFKSVECEIAKFQKTLLEGAKDGGWVTKTYLMNEKHWTKYIPELLFC